MPQNEHVYRLTAAAIEFAHDVGIDAVWPGLEPVQAGSCRDLNLLQSAAAQPFQECFGEELYPTLEAKAAYLFCHLVTAHVFDNGNKRTAVLCLDSFLLLNAHFLTLSEDEIYRLAKQVASSGERGISFGAVLQWVGDVLKEHAISFDELRGSNELLFQQCLRERRLLIEAPSNQPGALLRQAFRT